MTGRRVVESSWRKTGIAPGRQRYSTPDRLFRLYFYSPIPTDGSSRPALSSRSAVLLSLDDSRAWKPLSVSTERTGTFRSTTRASKTIFDAWVCLSREIKPFWTSSKKLVILAVSQPSLIKSTCTGLFFERLIPRSFVLCWSYTII